MLQTEQAQKRLETDGSYQNSNEAIYFSIYKIINPKDDNKLSNKKYLDKDLREVANSDTYFYQREVSKRFELPADEYVIIPSLFKMNVKMKFVLRMYIETSLADGTEYSNTHPHIGNNNDTVTGDSILGKRTLDGWWIKASVSPGRYHLCKGNGRTVEYDTRSEEDLVLHQLSKTIISEQRL